jgi:hypothetical protein
MISIDEWWNIGPQRRNPLVLCGPTASGKTSMIKNFIQKNKKNLTEVIEIIYEEDLVDTIHMFGRKKSVESYFSSLNIENETNNSSIIIIDDIDVILSTNSHFKIPKGLLKIPMIISCTEIKYKLIDDLVGIGELIYCSKPTATKIARILFGLNYTQDDITYIRKMNNDMRKIKNMMALNYCHSVNIDEEKLHNINLNERLINLINVNSILKSEWDIVKMDVI